MKLIVGPKMWNSISTELKQESSLVTFEKPTYYGKFYTTLQTVLNLHNGAGFLQVSHFLWFCYIHFIGILGLVHQNIRYLVFIFFSYVLYLCILLT